MKKIGLVILVMMLTMAFAGFVYAAVPTETRPQKMGGGAGFIKPEVAADQTFEVLPPGIEKRDDGSIPGNNGKHLGWILGNHNGWDEVEAEEIDNPEEENAALAPNNITEDKKKQDGKRTNWQITGEAGKDDKHGEVENKGPIVQ